MQLVEALELQRLFEADNSGLYAENTRLVQALEATRREKNHVVDQLVESIGMLEYHAHARNRGYFRFVKSKDAIAIVNADVDSVFAAARFSRARYNVLFTVGDIWPSAIQSIGSLTVDAVDVLRARISSLPDAAFDRPKGQNLRLALLSKVDEVKAKIETLELQDATSKLIHDIRPKVDGQPKPKDWVVEPNARRELLMLIDESASLLAAMLVE